MSQYLFQPCPNFPNYVKQDSSEERGNTKASVKRQQRYREKQRQYVDRLEAIVKHLRWEVDDRIIARHKAHKARFQEYLLKKPLQSSTIPASNILSYMRECMINFESGYQELRANSLESATCSGMRFRDQIGRNPVLHFFHGFMLEACKYRVDYSDQNLIVGRVSALLVIRLPRQLWASIFPHTFSNERLHDRMLQTSTLRLPLTVLFYFDGHGKACRHASYIDFVAGLYTVIRDYRDVACMLETAKLDTSGQICDGLPPINLQVDGDFCGDRFNHNRTETKPSCRRFTTTHKLAMSFLLSNEAEDQGADTAEHAMPLDP